MPDILRLSELIKALEAARQAGGQLHQGTWGDGHTCCVGGWAARWPAFNELGLIALPPKELLYRNGNILLVRKPKPLQGVEALAHFFDLTTTQAQFLFWDNPDYTGFETIDSFDEAIQRINDVMTGGPAEYLWR